MKLSLIASAGGAALSIAPTSAEAAVMLCYEVGSTQPQCGPTDDNVLVDKMTGTPVAGVSTVTGNLNSDPTQHLTFTSTTDTLVGDGSGQAVVSSLDGLLQSVTFALTDATFNLATFNLSPLTGNSPFTSATSVEVSYVPADGNSPITYTLSAVGNNFYGIYGSAGEQLQSITFNNFSPTGSGIADIRQVRVAGIESLVQNPVPEPSTWAMMLFGFAAVGFAMRRRKDGYGTKRVHLV